MKKKIRRGKQQQLLLRYICDEALVRWRRILYITQRSKEIVFQVNQQYMENIAKYPTNWKTEGNKWIKYNWTVRRYR